MVPQAVAGSPSAAAEHHPGSRRALLLAALGVVYGDIGTSPLYLSVADFRLPPDQMVGLGIQVEACYVGRSVA
jgi:hypothetical protein